MSWTSMTASTAATRTAATNDADKRREVARRPDVRLTVPGTPALRRAPWAALALTYVLGFIVTPRTPAPYPFVILLDAAPTIPVLFLFALLIPLAIAARSTDDAEAGRALHVAALIAAVVLVSASLLGPGAIVVSPVIVAASGVFLVRGPVVARLILAAVMGVLVDPLTGLAVMTCYDRLTHRAVGLPAGVLSPANAVLLGAVLVTGVLQRSPRRRGLAALTDVAFVVGTLGLAYSTAITS